jgi:NTP pyrophosphatase (non-canonical NTP hydrolase)
MMQIQEYVNKINDIAVRHGWYDSERSFGDIISLCHSELSEALEEYRNGHDPTEIYYNGEKPEGIPIELADCVIRIFDYCGANGIDIEEAINIKINYNEKRPYKHGGKVI